MAPRWIGGGAVQRFLARHIPEQVKLIRAGVVLKLASANGVWTARFE